MTSVKPVTESFWSRAMPADRTEFGVIGRRDQQAERENGLGLGFGHADYLSRPVLLPLADPIAANVVRS
ncbi:hypothetical protein [Streptomyces sp. NPDC088727]|uniref:hypothetical protein n=1 Tax=Streptomyces sp. NPDC088727 TaxID=3365875 RepID=UPI0037F82950